MITNLKPSYTYLRPNYFAPFRYLSERVSLGILITDLLIEVLNDYAKKKKGYLNFVVCPILDIFFQFSLIWNSNRKVDSIIALINPLLDSFISRIKDSKEEEFIDLLPTIWMFVNSI